MNDRVLWLIILVLATYTIIISFVSPMIHKKRMKEQEKARDIYLSKCVIIEIDKESIMGVLN